MTIMSNPTDKPFAPSEPTPAQSAPPVDAIETAPHIVIELEPDNAVQFVDAFVPTAAAATVRRRYYEDDAVIGAQDSGALYVVALDDGVFHHPVTGDIADAGQTYVVEGATALKAFAGAWLPVPLLRELAPDETGGRVLDQGPTNWARIFVARCEDADRDGWHVVLALDTTLARTAPARDRAGPSPTLADVVEAAIFIMSADENDVGAFLTEAWIDDWLREVYEENGRRYDGHGEADWEPARPLEHIAHYLTLLSVLVDTNAVPDVRFATSATDAEAADTVPVDLVVDIGAARTCALMRDAGADADPARPPIEQLAVRDLSRPWTLYRGILPSRCTFARTQFGKEALSRWSGRANAFAWPSIARIGAEAERLAAMQVTGTEQVGLSSPIRYLWDERRSDEVWRFARTETAGSGRGSIVSGPLLASIGETGDVLTGDARGAGTTKPRFSRASLVTFFAAELLMHAIGNLNPPMAWNPERNRTRRRLGRILLTVPGNLHADMQQALKRRVEDAIALVWQGIGWDQPQSRRRRPTVAFSADNATNVETVYLYNEIVHKFRGQAREYFDLMGRARPGQRAGRSLRIGAFDIGAGATAISVTTYELTHDDQVARVAELIDGLPAGGDDVVKAVIEHHILPALRDRLAESGLQRPDRFLTRILTPPIGRNADARLDGFASRLAAHLLRPAAIALLREHAAAPSLPDDVPVTRTLAFLLAHAGADARVTADALDELAAEEGAEAFSPLQTPVTYQHRDLAETIGGVLQPVLESAIRLVKALDCDIVLLSGWLSRLPVVLDTMVQGLPTRPNRIIAMHDYRVAAWYPGRLESERIAQPKTTAAVGGLLDAIGAARVASRGTAAEGQRLVLGRLGEGGTISAEDVLFTLLEPGIRDTHGGPTGERTATISAELPLVIGVRRPALESWPATPLYQIDFKDKAQRRDGLKAPFKITLERVSGTAGGYDNVSIVRACDADGASILPAELEVRGQTLASTAGHWLDTGGIALQPDGDRS